jgi:prepilin-type N-terminal cleavage/methylation domain-containing protein
MLSQASRRGFSLLETIIAMSMLLLVSGAVYRLLFTTQRLARAQAEHLTLQSSVRSAMLVALNELKDLNTAEGQGRERKDVLSGSSTAMTYRATRGIGWICQPLSATQIRVRRSGFVGARDPQAGRDSLFVFVEGNPATDEDDVWQPAAITAVSILSGCGGTLEPGITLSIAAPAPLVGIEPGTPVRIYEVMELRLYRSEGKSWLGLRSVSAGEAVQPLAGPLSDDGFQLEYLDRDGRLTADLSSIRSIQVAVQGVGEPEPSFNGTTEAPYVEGLVSRLALRNSARQ